MNMNALFRKYYDFPDYPPTVLKMSPVLFGWFVDRMRKQGEPPIFQGIKPTIDRDIDGFRFE